MITLLYVMSVLVAMLPWSYLVGWLGLSRLKVVEVARELRSIEKEYRGLRPQEKKAKILEERASKLRRRLSNFFIINLLVLWGGVFFSMLISEYMYLFFVLTYGGGKPIPSPLSLPVISSSEGFLNELFVFLATLVGYQVLHNRIAGIDLIRSEGVA
ncbi:MAG: hypothetical protein QN229_00975 [Desulfurococcaceae archaeon TW002]